MNEQSMRFRIGVFVLAAMILLAVLIVLFGGTPTIFKPQDAYTIWFDNAPGVAPGTPVRRSGVRIGQVRDVQLDDQTGKVRVTIVIDRPHVLFQDDQPVLVRGALSGDTTIDFVIRPAETQPAPDAPQHTGKEGAGITPVAYQLAQAPPAGVPAPPPQRAPVKPGTEFIGATQGDVATLIREMSKLAPPAQQAFAEMQKTLERYEKLTPIIEETLRQYRDLGKATQEMLPELRRTNEEAQVTARNWGKLGERLDVLLQTNQDKLVKTLDNLAAGTQNLESIARNTDELLKESRQTVRRFDKTVTETDKVLTNLHEATKPLAERSASVMKNLDEGADKLNKTLTDVRELLRVVDQGDGTLRRFLLDPSLYNNLNEAACQVTRILPRVDRIVHDFEVFADKIARHPESLGIGGVVSPSSGLKESPSSTSHWRSPGH